MGALLWSYLGWRRFPRELSGFEPRRLFALEASDRRELRVRYPRRPAGGGDPAGLRAHDWHDTRRPRLDPVDREIGGSLEKIGPQQADGARLIELEQARVGFLGDLSRVLLGSQARAQEAEEFLVVLAKQPRKERGAVLRLGRLMIWQHRRVTRIRLVQGTQ